VKTDIKQATEVLTKIVAVLDPLEPAERARVMLITILKMAPEMLSPAQLASLVEQAKEPCANELAPGETRCELTLGHAGSHRGVDGRRWA
jgi:hypothetical protein